MCRWMFGRVALLGLAALTAVGGASMAMAQADAPAPGETARVTDSRAAGGMGGLSCAKPPTKLQYDAAKQAKWIAKAREDGFTVLGLAHACGYGFLYRDRPLTQQAKAARSYTDKQQEQQMRQYGIDPNPWVAFSGGDLLLLVEDDAEPDVRRDGTYLRALYPRGWMSRGHVSRANVQWLEEVEDSGQ